MPTFMVYTYKEPQLLSRLCHVLRPFPVLIHVDAKVPLDPFRAQIQPVDQERVHFLPTAERVRVNWAGFSQVRAIRNLVRRATTMTAPDDYLVMLSGQDYPLRPVSELVDHLRSTPGRQYIRFFNIAATSGKRYRHQIDRRHHRDLPFLDGHVLTGTIRKMRTAAILGVDLLCRILPPPRPPAHFAVAHGPTHFAITTRCAIEISNLATPAIDAYFRQVFCPEGKYYHSLVANSRFLYDTPAGGYEPYVGLGDWRYAILHHIDPSLVRVFTLEDWDEIVRSPAYFLRKVEAEASGELLDRIDSEVLRV